MATIIPFPDVTKTNRQARDEGCHVFIFPGVRIEREPPAAQKAKPRTAAKPRRKTQRSKRTA